LEIADWGFAGGTRGNAVGGAPNKPNHPVYRGSNPAGYYIPKMRSGERKQSQFGRFSAGYGGVDRKQTEFDVTTEIAASGGSSQ
jgi:hypothetical protein